MLTLLPTIHTGPQVPTFRRNPDFVASVRSYLEKQRPKDIENALKQFIMDYSNNFFQAFHQTIEFNWSNKGNHNDL